MKTSGTLKVIPDSITFRELLPGDTDVMDVWITNKGISPARVRCSIGNKTPFTLSTEGTLYIPPGLEKKITVSYKASDNRVYTADLKIECTGSSVTIPVRATPPAPNVVADVSQLNLGLIGVDTVFKFQFSITNIGANEGTYSVVCENEQVQFQPSTGNIGPGKSQEIHGTLTPRIEGELQFPITIKSSESTEPPSVITLRATTGKHSLSLMLDKVEAKEFDFQTIFFKQKKIIRATINNSGMYKRSFVVLQPQDNPIDSGRSTYSAATDSILTESVFTIEPAEGLLNPYSSIPINLIFTPKEDTESIDDLEIMFNQFSSIEVVETGQRIDFTLAGKAVHHLVSLSAMDFDFGKSEIREKNSLPLKINNESQYLPTKFEIEPIAHFRFHPSKGEIEPSKSKEVSLVFFPKNFGEFETVTTVTFCHGLFKKRINLVAKCGQTTEKPFKRIPAWETDENARYTVMHPDKTLTYGIDEIRSNSVKRSRFDGYITSYAKKRARLTQVSELRTRSRKEARSQLAHTIGQFTEEDIEELAQKTLEEWQTNEENMGMNAHEGLTPPDPPLTRKPAPLYLLHPEKFGAVEESEKSNVIHRRKKLHVDDNVLIKKKFKSKATTPQEITECSKALTPAQQLQISSSHSTLNFGQVSVFSTVAKSFTIMNNLQQHILVAINFEYDELSQSTPPSQVIPPRSTTGFDVKFSSKKQISFMKTIHYTINGHHNYTLAIQAQVVPIDIQLSRNLIEFRFSPDSISPHIKEFVTVTNKSIGKAEFNWTGMNSAFQLSIPQGTIDANKVQNLEITYTPSTHPHDEVTLVMNVTGGASRALKCIGDVGVPKCSLSKKVVNFGLIPIGVVRTQTIRVKNSGDDDAIFTISHGNMNEVSISPMNGRIASHDYQMLQINFKSFHAHSFDLPVNIAIAGAQPISFNITGQSELPQVQLLNSEFDFGRLFVGSSASIEATISNIGAIPAILFLDLRTHPEFRIEFSTDLVDDGGNDKSNSISLINDAVFVTKSDNQSNFSATSSMKSISIDLPPEQDEQPKQQETGLVYRFTIIENSTINFNLVFQPREVNEHSFELPITMMNVISASSFHLQPIVSAEAIHAPVSISVSSLDFGISPIFDDQNPHSRPVVRQIKLQNEQKGPLKWHFDVSDPLFQGPECFNIEPSQGEIEIAQNKVVHVSFMPRLAIPYNVHLPIYVKSDKDEDTLIGTIQLTGIGTNILFRMSSNNISLPIVPLNVNSMMQIYVLNDAFIETSLKVKLPVDENHFPLKIVFPQGNQLQYTTAKLPVNVSFCSNKPLSFSTHVALIDDAGHAASFTVSVTTDNSYFTLYPFFSTRQFEVRSGDGKPIIYECKKVTKPVELTSIFTNASDFIDLRENLQNGWRPSCNQMVISYIQRYMNALVLNTQLSDFPNDFISNDFQLVIEILSNLQNGKKINFETDTRGTTEKISDPLSRRFDISKNMLAYLKSFGANIASVQPEFLLSKSDFLQLMRNKVTKKLLGIDRFNAPDLNTFDQQTLSEFTSSKSYSDALLSRLKILENLYQSLSVESWMMVIMQIMKIFIMGRIETDKLTKTPGISDAIKNLQATSSRFSQVEPLMAEIVRPPKSILASNVFSPAEGILLKWVSIHHCNVMNDLQKPLNNFLQLNDSLPLVSLIKAHTNIFHGQINDHPLDRTQREHNAIELTNAMKDLKLGFCPHAEEIIDGDQCMLALTLAYLFENLPHFIPISQLEFSTTLHKTITKTISIGNPSKAEIMYKANLEAPNNYVLPNQTIIVNPNSSVEFPIQFTARSIKPVAGRITLVPSRPRFQNATPPPEGASGAGTARQGNQMPTFSAPIVVDLISSVTLSQPDGSYTIEGQIYQSTKLTIPLSNFIGIPSKVRLFPKVTQIVDETGRNINQQKPLQQQMMELISNPDVVNIALSNAEASFAGYLRDHKTFIFNHNEIEFQNETSIDLDVEFVPITLGSFRCLALFEDKDNGEFIIDIVAKSVLPPPTDVAIGKFKEESGKRFSLNVPVEIMNTNLIKAVAYSIEKSQLTDTFYTERKLKDLLTRRQRECENQCRQQFTSLKFNVANSSPQYFEMSSEINLFKSTLIDSLGKGVPKEQINAIPITFKPTKAGDYPVKIVLLSKYDIRVYSIKAIGLTAARELALDFSTVAGKSIKQEIPLQNKSNEQIWNYKITISGDSCFSATPKFSVKPNQTAFLPITFNPYKIGTYSGECTILNLQKEATLIYHLTAVVEEAPAEAKVSVDCQARSRVRKTLEVKSSYIRNGTMAVTTTIPIIRFQSEIQFVNGQPETPFEYTIYAPRSGVAAGTITFTDTATKNYIWYILEIHVDTPAPEQTIKVQTTARKCVTVNIPIANPKDGVASFKVDLSDDDMFGEKVFQVPPKSTGNYVLIVSPLKSMKRNSSVYFYSDDDGEFWYSLKIEAGEAPENTVAPLSSPLGKHASTYIDLENPLEKTVNFRVENDNQTAFHIVSKRVVTLTAKEKKRVEVRYIPTSVGQKEIATISFKSNEIGDWVYKLTGTGRPPQPLSPIIVSSQALATNSALVLFSNPYPYPARFSISLSTDYDEIFKFLGKRKIFTLNTFGEEYQIPFTFTPTLTGQFNAHIIVASLGPARGPLPDLNQLPGIQWIFPIIGNALASESNDMKVVRCRAHDKIEIKESFSLVGETEIFEPHDYQVQVSIPSNFEFVNSVLDIRPVQIQRHEKSSDIVVCIKFAPMRPLQVTASLAIRNPLGQEWQFQVDFHVDRGRSTSTITIESLLNKTGESTITIPWSFRQKVPFHVYFVSGSAQEFSVTPTHGFIENSFGDSTLIPSKIIFAPKMYGKVLKGLLVVDTLDTQFLFDVEGKTPEYVPPIVPDGSSVSRLDNVLPPEDLKKLHDQKMQSRKRNIIKENIDSVKIAKPFLHSPHHVV